MNIRFERIVFVSLITIFISCAVVYGKADHAIAESTSTANMLPQQEDDERDTVHSHEVSLEEHVAAPYG